MLSEPSRPRRSRLIVFIRWLLPHAVAWDIHKKGSPVRLSDIAMSWESEHEGHRISSAQVGRFLKQAGIITAHQRKRWGFQVVLDSVKAKDFLEFESVKDVLNAQ